MPFFGAEESFETSETRFEEKLPENKENNFAQIGYIILYAAIGILSIAIIVCKSKRILIFTLPN